MNDDERISDAELARRVAAHDAELAKQVRARLRRLRLARILNQTPPPQPSQTAH